MRLLADLGQSLDAFRVRALAGYIVPHLNSGDRVLVVRCGNGQLGHRIWTHSSAPVHMVIEGLERSPSAREPIRVLPHNSERFPAPDGSYDVVIAADALRFERNPEQVARECVRVARRLVIVKDIRAAGPIGALRARLCDRLCPRTGVDDDPAVRYAPAKAWRDFSTRFSLTTVQERDAVEVFPGLFDDIIGHSLHFFGVYAKQPAAGESTPSRPSSAPASSSTSAPIAA